MGQQGILCKPVFSN